MKILNYSYMNELKIKKYDILIIVSLILLSFLPMLIFAGGYTGSNERYAVIYVNGDIYKEIKLGEGSGCEIEVDNGAGFNRIKIEGYNVYMSYSDCRDKYCIRQGIANKPGQTIVCLPNRVLVEITGGGEPLVDEISH
jgi:hypothetical protein